MVRPIISHAQVNVQDSLALVDFYDSTDGTHWRNPDAIWDLSSPVSNWYGVGITNNRVVSLNLTGVIGSGKIPSSFGNLTALTCIDFLDDKLTDATLPASFGNLTNLTYLKMSAVFYNLPFPTAITKLTNLNTLALEINLFTDTIPNSIGNLSQLTYLDLSTCVVGNKIPRGLENLKKLKHLALTDNHLTDTIPAYFNSLDSLEWLDLSENLLYGAIPLKLSNFKNLSLFGIGDNAYTFNGIEPLVTQYNSANSSWIFGYNGQANLPITRHHNKLSISAGGSLSDNTFSWYKDSVLVATIAGDSTFTPLDTGRYYVAINNSIATNLTLYGNEFTFNYVLPDSGISVTQNISGTSPININDDIFEIAQMQPTVGPDQLTGNVMVSVNIDTLVQTYHSQPYVQRHYDITPETNASTAQATVTLYFTQDDFDNYNTYITNNSLSLPLLPTGELDNGNVRITQFHGSFTGSSDPGNYADQNAVLITPASVVWNSANQWWAITFPVTGFSGFFLSAANSTLPVTLLSFTGKAEKSTTNLQWTTTN
ncbi:MAG: hypothetical protein Q8891_03535 [Bacteroidota bacterium]|nr:hypothetical protein [Bacteroidota bacterium]